MPNMSDVLSEPSVLSAQELPLGTMFNVHFPDGDQATYVSLGRLASKFKAGDHICASLALPGDGEMRVGIIRPAPKAWRPEVIGHMQEDRVMQAVENQLGYFSVALVHWLDGSGPEPWAASSKLES